MSLDSPALAAPDTTAHTSFCARASVVLMCCVDAACSSFNRAWKSKG